MREFFQQIKHRDFLWLSILVCSYFYCLPLGRFSIGVWASDFRLYDYISIFFILFLFKEKKIFSRVKFIFKQKNTFTFYVRLLLLLSVFSLFWHFIYSGFSFLLPTLIRLFRFIIYFSTSAWVISICYNKERWNALLNLFIFLIAIVGLIAFLQGLNIIPNFWPLYWREMYDLMDPPVATLSPHHKHIGTIMLVGVGLSLYKFRISVGLIKYVWIFITLIFITVPLFTGSRTILLGYLGFIPAYFIYNKSKTLLTIPILFIVGIFFVFVLGDNIINPIQNKFETKVSGRIEKLGYEGLYEERTVVYNEIFSVIFEKPYLLLTGTGFQNIQKFVKANGAHNNYLQALIEQGIFGLFFFVSILISMFRNFNFSEKLASNNKIIIFSRFIKIIFWGICLTLFVGDSMWAQAAMFTLPGQLMIIFGLGATPGFWKLMKIRGYGWAQKTNF